LFRRVEVTAAERAEVRPGDELVPTPDVVMDRGLTLAGPPATVWPWLEQLGKRRAGWYLPRRVERLLPPSRRAVRRIEPCFLGLGPGDVIPDYGGRNETFEVVSIDQPHSLVYTSRRGRATVTWSIVLRATGPSDTRVLFRLRMAPVKHIRLARSLGDLVDLLTIAGLAGGLRERIADDPGNAVPG
jgi:hypothetical protein